MYLMYGKCSKPLKNMQIQCWTEFARLVGLTKPSLKVLPPKPNLFTFSILCSLGSFGIILNAYATGLCASDGFNWLSYCD